MPLHPDQSVADEALPSARCAPPHSSNNHAKLDSDSSLGVAAQPNIHVCGTSHHPTASVQLYASTSTSSALLDIQPQLNM